MNTNIRLAIGLTQEPGLVQVMVGHHPSLDHRLDQGQVIFLLALVPSALVSDFFHTNRLREHAWVAIHAEWDACLRKYISDPVQETFAELINRFNDRCRLIHCQSAPGGGDTRFVVHKRSTLGNAMLDDGHDFFLATKGFGICCQARPDGVVLLRSAISDIETRIYIVEDNDDPVFVTQLAHELQGVLLRQDGTAVPHASLVPWKIKTQWCLSNNLMATSS